MDEDFQAPIRLVLDRRRKFNALLDNSKDLKELGLSFTCPSCGYPTLSDRQNYEICILCWWEDDGQDDEDADEVRGGPNGDQSLNDSRILFETNKNIVGPRPVDKQWASVNKRIIDCYERILVETDPVKRTAISKELPALYKEHGDILRQHVEETQKLL